MIFSVTIAYVSIAPSPLLRPLPEGQGGLLRKTRTYLSPFSLF
jgi:hypothetical protein